MAINWSAGLISAGGSFKDYSAVLLKEEYMAEAKATAAHTSLMDRYSTLLDTVTDSISDNIDEMGDIIDPDRQESLYIYQNVLMNALETGKQIPAGTVQAMAELAAKAGTQDTEEESEDVEAASGFWSAMYADTLGKALPEGLSWIKEKMQESLKGLSEEKIKKPETIIESAKKIPGAWEAIKNWWSDTKFGSGSGPGQGDAIRQEHSSPLHDVGLIEQGAATPEQEATMAAGGVQGGSGYVEPEIAQETVSDISGVVGSEEALTSLFRDVGGPVGEPAGKTTVRDFVIGEPEVEIEVSPPEIEERKSTILSNVFSAIRDTESNVMGYSAVADTTDGDRGLTTSTVGEIVNKHGNKAIGIGQFKFNEFIKPTAKKWFGMSEAQLKDQMFTPQFQDALVVAGLYDAGLQQFADGKIDAATFQKRIANIWRGLPPDKDTKEGDPTDDLGNKARMSGEEFRGLIEQGMTGQ